MSDHDGKSDAIQYALLAIDGIASIESKNEFSELPNVLCDGELPFMAIKCGRAPSIGNGLMIATDRRVVWLRKGRDLVVKQMSYAEMASIEAKRPGGTITFVGPNDKLELINTTKSLTLAFVDFVREKAAMAHVPQGSYPDDDAVATNAAAVDEHLVGLDSDTPKAAAIKDALRTVQGIHGIGIKNEFAELPNVLADGELPRAAMKCALFDASGGSGLAVATDQRIVWLRKGRNVDVRDVSYSAMVSVEAKEGKIDGELIVTFVNDLGSLYELKLTNTTKTLTSAFADFVREKVDSDGARFGTVDRALGLIYASDPKAAAIRAALRNADGINELADRMDLVNLPKILNDGELPAMLMACSVDSDIGLLLATNERIIHIHTIKGGKRISWKNQMSYAELTSVEVSDSGDAIKFSGVADELRVNNTTGSLTSAFADFVREKAAMAHVPQGSYPDDDAVATNAAAVDEHLVGLDSDTPKAAAIKDALRTVQGIHGIGIKNEFAELPNVLADGELPRAAMKCALFDASGGSGLAVATDQRIVWLRKGRNVDVRDVSYSAMVSVEAKEGKIDGELIVTFVNDLGSLYELKLTNTTKTLTSAFADFVREKVDSDGARFGTVDRALGLIYASDPKAAAIRAALRNADGINELADRMDLVNLPKILNDGELPAMLMACSVDSDIGLLLATNERIIHIHTIKGGKRISWKNQMSYAELTSVEVSDSGDAIKFSGVADELRVNNTTGSLTSAFADFVREKAAMAHVPQGSYPDDDAVATNAAAVDEHLVGLDSDTPKAAAIKDALRTVQGIHGIGIKNEFAELPNVLADGELPRAAMKCALFDASGGSGLAVATDQRIVWLRKGRNVDVRDVSYSAMVSVEAKEGKVLGELTVTFVNDLGSLDELKLANTTKTLTSAFADFVREKVDSDGARFGTVDRAFDLIYASDPKAAAIRAALRNADGINELAGRMELVELPKVLNDGELPAMLMACSVGSDIGLLLATNERIIHIKGGKRISWKNQMSYAELTSVEVSDLRDAIKFSGVAGELRVNNATASLTLAFADFVREKAAQSIAAKTEAAEQSQAKAKVIIEALRASGADNAMFSNWEVKALPDILDDGELPEKIIGGQYNGSIGVLVATDRRLLFVDRGSFGSLQVEDFPYPTIQSVLSTAGMMYGSITIKSAGSSALIDNTLKRFSHEMANFVRKKAMDFNGTAAPVAATGTANQVSLADELIKLSQLRESGILTDEEFQMQKDRLLA